MGYGPEGRMQTMMEVWPISRHLGEFKKGTKDSMCYFVAPSIFKVQRLGDADKLCQRKREPFNPTENN